MAFADQGSRHMAGLQIEIVTRAEQVRRHGGNEVAAMLTAIGLAKLHTGDLCHSVPFVGWFERPGKQRVLADRLIREFRIDAGGGKKHQLAHADAVGAVNDVRLDHEVVVEEIRGLAVIG
jgi:hypothetical protein